MSSNPDHCSGWILSQFGMHKYLALTELLSLHD